METSVRVRVSAFRNRRRQSAAPYDTVLVVADSGGKLARNHADARTAGRGTAAGSASGRYAGRRFLAGISVALLDGRNRDLLWIGAGAAMAFLAQALLRKAFRSARIA